MYSKLTKQSLLLRINKKKVEKTTEKHEFSIYPNDYYKI